MRPRWIPPWWGFGLVMLLVVAALIFGPAAVCYTNGCL